MPTIELTITVDPRDLRDATERRTDPAAAARDAPHRRSLEALREREQAARRTILNAVYDAWRQTDR